MYGHSQESIGLLKRGTIVSFNQSSGVLKVRLNTASAVKGGQAATVDVNAPHSLFHNNGLFIGTSPVPGTAIVVGQGVGGEYHFVSFLAENLPKVPDLDPGVLLIHSNDDTRITLDLKNNIVIGSSINNIHIHTDSNYVSTNFYSEYNFTQASRKINGVIKRDTAFNTQFSQDNKLESDDYDSQFKVIGMDPSVPVTDTIAGSAKNPPLVENRELIYEFQFMSDVVDDLTESAQYGKSPEATKTKYTFPNRRISRADTLSLSLASPNYLIETIKGTVVDIFGNLIDLNRNLLPIGQDQNTIKVEQSTDKIKSFLLIKELERKSLAYHFEINARKDLISATGNSPTLPDVTSNSDYARARSRFFLDIDKEGQFKLNVPASSEKGNIPLLTRYENYSTFGSDDNNNPNKLVYRTDHRDIYQDSFSAQALDVSFQPIDNGKGSIRLVGGDNKDALSAPQDRITKKVIKHGMAYHDILKTCFTHQDTSNSFISYAGGIYAREDINSIKSIPPLTDIASSTIIVSGDKANAGGRSGSINFDGSIEMNIGANTVDRQSLWLDLAGGSVVNLGRDKHLNSAVVQADGNVYMQIGSFGISTDSRFAKEPNGISGGILDLRILTPGGTTHLIRCDSQGITIMSPGNVAIHANGVLELTSNTSIRMDAPNMTLHGRVVLNGPIISI